VAGQQEEKEEGEEGLSRNKPQATSNKPQGSKEKKIPLSSPFIKGGKRGIFLSVPFIQPARASPLWQA
jgi:hypothetical protein